MRQITMRVAFDVSFPVSDRDAYNTDYLEERAYSIIENNDETGSEATILENSKIELEPEDLITDKERSHAFLKGTAGV